MTPLPLPFPSRRPAPGLPRVSLLVNASRHFGLRWVLRRARYLLEQQSGHLARRLPVAAWDDEPLAGALAHPSLADPERYADVRRERASRFLFRPGARKEYRRLLRGWDGNGGPVAAAEAMEQGRFTFFDFHLLDVGCPPDWHLNPLAGRRAPSDLHWSRIADFGHGDIKAIWELSRFGFVYTLVRAYWRDGDDRWAALFWRLVEDWREMNPPQRGPNWKCGQEISFRLMAWCFGLHGFLESPATTPERVAMLAQMIAVSAGRIEGNLAYALSQENNHAVSEAAGLWTAGALFPELREAGRWERTGRKLLERLGRRLIYEDGSFVQHSVNYHRLMMHDYIWAIRLADLLGRPFSPQLRQRLERACSLAFGLQDEATGALPWYGQNDGAHVLPLSNCDHHDFRPVVQAAWYLCTGSRCYESGPWDEALLWLFGPEALRGPLGPPSRGNLAAAQGGYYTLRGGESFLFTRCARYRHRPGQADMLHVDLWWRGQNIAADAGTYSYNALPPWNNPLAHTAHHNTVTVDGEDQMDRLGRFLWFPWLKGEVVALVESGGGGLSYWEGRHDGYLRLRDPVIHRRAVCQVAGDFWLVLDSLEGAAEHLFRLHWLFPDLAFEWDEEAGHLKLLTRAGPYHVKLGLTRGTGTFSLSRAEADSPRGWRSRYYLHREPALSLDFSAPGSRALFWTLLGPEPVKVAADDAAARLETGSWRATVRLLPQPAETIVKSISVEGENVEELQVPECTHS